ncbi:MAG: hypothetical protein AAFP84_05195 [Actinomycetota bacterium]
MDLIGRLTTTWRSLLALAWAAAFFAYAAVWQASVQLGIGTWWLGPRADPTPVLLRLSPFVVCLTMAILVAYAVRRLPLISALASGGLVLFALPDFSWSAGLALTELTIAGALVAVSAVSNVGIIRPAASQVGDHGDE